MTWVRGDSLEGPWLQARDTWCGFGLGHVHDFCPCVHLQNPVERPLFRARLQGPSEAGRSEVSRGPSRSQFVTLSISNMESFPGGVG